jgi:hypothetical protein
VEFPPYSSHFSGPFDVIYVGIVAQKVSEHIIFERGRVYIAYNLFVCTSTDGTVGRSLVGIMSGDCPEVLGSILVETIILHLSHTHGHVICN